MGGLIVATKNSNRLSLHRGSLLNSDAYIWPNMNPGGVQEDGRWGTHGTHSPDGPVWSVLGNLPLSHHINRPISQVPGEIRGFLDRAAYMLSIAESSLQDVSLEDTDKPGFKRFIKRVPLGVVLVIAPWKWVFVIYMLEILTCTQLSIFGFCQLCPSSLDCGQFCDSQTFTPNPACWRKICEHADQSGSTSRSSECTITLRSHKMSILQNIAIQTIHLTPTQTQFAASHPLVSFVSFTGSVLGGRGIERAVVNGNNALQVDAEIVGLKGVGLEVCLYLLPWTPSIACLLYLLWWSILVTYGWHLYPLSWIFVFSIKGAFLTGVCTSSLSYLYW